MINANEIRIGNLVYGVSDRIETVTGISRGKIYTQFAHVPMEVGPDSLFGIPLSEEWLLRFGFDKSYDNWGGYIAPKINGYSMRIRINTIGICYFSMNMVGKPIYIDYVHQLQNLYYALTQTELELKK